MFENIRHIKRLSGCVQRSALRHRIRHPLERQRQLSRNQQRGSTPFIDLFAPSIDSVRIMFKPIQSRMLNVFVCICILSFAFCRTFTPMMENAFAQTWSLPTSSPPICPTMAAAFRGVSSSSKILKHADTVSLLWQWCTTARAMEEYAMPRDARS